jgi:hypothetical protein
MDASGRAPPQQTAAETTLDKAHELLARGFTVFPADHPVQSKCIGAHNATPCDGKRGKHPAVAFSTWNVVTDAMLDINWQRRGGLANPAVACGPSHLVVLDDDGDLDKWATTYGIALPDTYTVTTGRGRHLYYRWDHTVEKVSNPDFTEFNMDVRGAGGYVIAEGALHASGAAYVGNGLDVAQLPLEVAEVLLARQNRHKSAIGPGLDGSGGGTGEPFWENTAASENPNTAKIVFRKRHRTLVAYAGRLRARGLDYHEAAHLFQQRWLLCEQPIGQIPEARYHSTPPADCNYPVTWGEAEAKLADVYGRYPAGHPETGAPRRP